MTGKQNDKLDLVWTTELLNRFKVTPKDVRQKSYLEICKYPGSRFEEVCSRILSFYLNPNEDHGLSDLLIKSLFEVLEKPYNTSKNVTISEEVNADGKRLDLLIELDSTVIGIENKITAELYNPLDIYWKKLKEYDKTTIGIVLSVKPIYGEGIKKMEDNNFIAVLYKEWFSKIKQNLGSYYRNDKLEYIAYLNDFISTIENMEKDSHLNPELKKFFFENNSELNKLRDLHNKFNEENGRITSDKLINIKELVSRKRNENWDVWEGWQLYFLNALEGYKIGIASRFYTVGDNLFGKFSIKIHTWDPDSWNLLIEKISKSDSHLLNEKLEYPSIDFLTIEGDQANENDFIVKKLLECIGVIESVLKER